MNTRPRSPWPVLMLALGAVVAIAPTSIRTAAAVPTGLAAPALSPFVTVRGSAAPLLPSGAVRLAPPATAQRLSIDVTLRVPDPAALRQYIADLSDRSSPLFHHFLPPGQFGPMFGPSLSEVRAVESVLRRDGLTVSSVASDRLSVQVSSTLGAIEKAFHVDMARYRLLSGRIALANTAPPEVPASVSAVVQGVLGLNDLYRAQSPIARAPHRSLGQHKQLARRLSALSGTAGPKPCAAATSAAATFGAYTADQLASYYAISPLYSLGDLGQGVKVALVELEPNSTGDIAAYEACYGLSTTVNYEKIDDGAGSGYGQGEAAGDIEDVMGIAPDATIDVYQTPNGDQYAAFSTIVNDDVDNVVSMSWGLCELDSDPSLMSAEQDLFAQAASQGQTVLAAAGDTGSSGCLGDAGSSYASDLSVLDPASQPYVVGVGGTSIGTNSESVWNGSEVSGPWDGADGAGGGGLSASWCMPSYQDQADIPGLISAQSESDSTECGTTTPYRRQVPDVSADADPASGYVFYYDGHWGDWGGTSLAAPLWAAIAALIDASPFCGYYGSGTAGVLPEGLYEVASTDESFIYSSSPEALDDVTSGNNDYSPSGYVGGLYPATAGYDMASGLGTPLLGGVVWSSSGSLRGYSNYVPGLAALMCWAYGTKLGSTSITGVSPKRGPRTTSTTVAISGTGFLPIAGADELEVGSKWIVATCQSTTRCTVVLPATEASTVKLRMSVEELTLSPVTAADQFTFVAVPVVTSVIPRSGPKKGGRKVTIRGSSLSGATVVHFGSKIARHLHLVSSTELRVTAPSGSGTVYVTVTTPGGTSANSAAARFTY